MAEFMVSATYTPERIQALLKDGGPGPQSNVEMALEELGGTLKTIYFSMGKQDVVAIVDLPDSVPATALILAINASGAVRTHTMPLTPPEAIGQAMGKTA